MGMGHCKGLVRYVGGAWTSRAQIPLKLQQGVSPPTHLRAGRRRIADGFQTRHGRFGGSFRRWPWQWQYHQTLRRGWRRCAVVRVAVEAETG